MYSVYDSSQKIHLIGSKAFGLLLEQWGILIDDILICRLKIMFGSSSVRVYPYQPRQLLHIRRVVIHGLAYFFRQLS